ncbi:hypothetical protein [Actinomadura rupiterrae]|uniref:hypothetical protein n=1 Tax=Actinomadura rupiterrae TaxID=559627 RepID=UPI0020A60D45|nr:hypothetical protein [Actinomadura rupiterrae]MCP2343160.1 hypothetical protein [Actinomadura rupiterrae]
MSTSPLRDPHSGVSPGPLMNPPALPLRDVRTMDPPAQPQPPTQEPAAADDKHNASGGPGQGGGDPHQVFTGVLLSVVGAYGVTGSVPLTVLAAVVALLVTLLISRRR